MPKLPQDQVVLGWADPADAYPRVAVVFESQTSRDDAKGFSWPVYVAALRAEYQCGVILVVFCRDEATAAWAGDPVELGHPGFVLRPLVVGPSSMPVITDAAVAGHHPGLGVLSALHHAGDPAHGDDVFRAMVSGLDTLDDERARFYMDGLLTVLDEAVSRHLKTLMETDVTMQKYHSEYARTYYDAGEAQGEVKGEAKAVLTVLDARGIQVPEQTRQLILACTDAEQLEAWVTRAVTAESLDDLFV